jgi:hypothetical protein
MTAQPDLFESRLYADLPRSRSTDPQSSHAAAEEVKSSGRLALQQAQVLDAVRRWPGRTSRELARYIGGDRYVVARRLPELEVALKVRKGGTRLCSMGGRPAVEWWPC